MTLKARDIRVRQIRAADAKKIVKALHYSGKVAATSCLHYGVFLGGRCGGAIQLGAPICKKNTLAIVPGTPWNGFLELNRMALADWLPRNSESRALGWILRDIRKRYPHIQWVISYADACQCGDGAIYRASGFILTDIRKNTDLLYDDEGNVVHSITARVSGKRARQRMAQTRGASSVSDMEKLEGFQLRYIFFLDPAARDRLAGREVPFSEIQTKGAGMYRGKKKQRGSAPEA